MNVHFTKVVPAQSDNTASGGGARYESARSTMNARTWYWTQDWPLEPDHEVSLEIETYDAGNQVPLPGTFVELRTKSMSGADASLFSGYSDGNGKIQVVVDDRDFIVSNAQKATYVELNKISATGKSMLAGDEDARRIRLAPTVGCDEIYGNQDGNSTRVFDLGAANQEFCFQVCNFDIMDHILVLDDHGNVLYDLDYATNTKAHGFDPHDPTSYERNKLVSPTQRVHVEVREGESRWWYEVNCAESGCLNISGTQLVPLDPIANEVSIYHNGELSKPRTIDELNGALMALSLSRMNPEHGWWHLRFPVGAI